MEELYHIFEVYDYKGGELSSSINLTKEKFLSKILYLLEGFIENIFESGNYDDELTDEDWNNYDNKITTNEFLDRFITEEFVSKYLYEDNVSEYAGGDGYVGEWYISKNNKLETYSLTSEDCLYICERLKQLINK